MQTIANTMITPWDSRVFGIDTYEIKSISENELKKALSVPGHYTIRVEPLSSKEILNKYGFYYCDTLIEPYCTHDNFVFFENKKASLRQDVDIENAISVIKGSFLYSRFRRDFNLDNQLSDMRYEQWLREIYSSGNLLTLVFDEKFAGFFGYTGGRIELHALADEFRGKGVSKYLWSAACEELFKNGCSEITSSISAANVPVLNLYCSLGFRFRNPKDIYHKLVT